MIALGVLLFTLGAVSTALVIGVVLSAPVAGTVDIVLFDAVSFAAPGQLLLLGLALSVVVALACLCAGLGLLVAARRRKLRRRWKDAVADANERESRNNLLDLRRVELQKRIDELEARLSRLGSDASDIVDGPVRWAVESPDRAALVLRLPQMPESSETAASTTSSDDRSRQSQEMWRM